MAGNGESKSTKNEGKRKGKSKVESDIGEDHSEVLNDPPTADKIEGGKEKKDDKSAKIVEKTKDTKEEKKKHDDDDENENENEESKKDDGSEHNKDEKVQDEDEDEDEEVEEEEEESEKLSKTKYARGRGSIRSKRHPLHSNRKRKCSMKNKNSYDDSDIEKDDSEDNDESSESNDTKSKISSKKRKRTCNKTRKGLNFRRSRRVKKNYEDSEDSEEEEEEREEDREEVDKKIKNSNKKSDTKLKGKDSQIPQKTNEALKNSPGPGVEGTVDSTDTDHKLSTPQKMDNQGNETQKSKEHLNPESNVHDEQNNNSNETGGGNIDDNKSENNNTMENNQNQDTTINTGVKEQENDTQQAENILNENQPLDSNVNKKAEKEILPNLDVESQKQNKDIKNKIEKPESSSEISNTTNKHDINDNSQHSNNDSEEKDDKENENPLMVVSSIKKENENLNFVPNKEETNRNDTESSGSLFPSDDDDDDINFTNNSPEGIKIKELTQENELLKKEKRKFNDRLNAIIDIMKNVSSGRKVNCNTITKIVQEYVDRVESEKEKKGNHSPNNSAGQKYDEKIAKIQSLTEELEWKNEQIKKMKDKVVEMEKEKQELVNNIRSNEEFEQELRDKRNNINELVEQNKRLKAKINTFSDSVDKMEFLQALETSDTLKKKMEDVRDIKLIAMETDQLSNYITTLAKINTKMVKAVQKYDLKIEKLKEKEKELLEQKASLSERNNELENEIKIINGASQSLLELLKRCSEGYNVYSPVFQSAYEKFGTD